MLLMNAENDPVWEEGCISELVDRRVDGLLISATHRINSREAIEEAADRLPVVQIDRYATSSVDRVVTDPLKTVRLCVDHMAAQGCSTFAFVGAKLRRRRPWHVAWLSNGSLALDPGLPGTGLDKRLQHQLGVPRGGQGHRQPLATGGCGGFRERP